MQENDLSLINKFPEIKLPNRFFRNTGKLAFEDEGNKIKNDRPTYSNGAVYADFDNDGDLDIVVSNIDEPALLYRNTANDKNNKHFLVHTIKRTSQQRKCDRRQSHCVLRMGGSGPTKNSLPVAFSHLWSCLCTLDWIVPKWIPCSLYGPIIPTSPFIGQIQATSPSNTFPANCLSLIILHSPVPIGTPLAGNRYYQFGKPGVPPRGKSFCRV